MLTNTFNALLEISITTGVIILVLLLLSPLLNKTYAAKWKYWVWLILAVRLLLPVNLSLPQAPVQITMPKTHLTVLQNMQPANTQPISPGPEHTSIVQQAAPITEPDRQPIKPVKIAMIIWLGGFLLFLLHQWIAYLLFQKQVLRWSRPLQSGFIAEKLAEISSKMKIRKPIVPLISEKVSSPMMIGFIRPLLLLPHEDYTDTELTFIFKHELTHFKRHDIWYKLLLLFANAVHWFNPLVYLMLREAGKDLELSCDDEVTKGADFDIRKQYSEAILASMHRKHARKTALSTYFYGGKKTMKERFHNILNAGKKRRGTVALCVVIAVAGISGALVAFGPGSGAAIDNDPALKPGTIYSHNSSGEQVISYDAGNSYSLDEQGNVIISYNNGKTTVKAPLTLHPNNNDYAGEADPGVYISEEKTAIAYGGRYGEPVYVLISDDMGKTWYTSDMVLKGVGVSGQYIGFITKNDGWLVVCSFHGMGHEDHYIYKTADGGKTWTEVVGNANDVYARVLTGAGFADGEIGFLCFRYDFIDFEPAICRSQDGGLTWEKLYIALPEEFVEYSKTPLSPVFNGANGLFPIVLSNHDGDIGIIYLASDDYGKTWTCDKKYNLARIWADAWKTRNGKPRYAIMSSQMQADFRAQQEDPDNFVIRWSSPWVERYDVAMNGEQAVITYWYADSTGSKYKGVERLTFGEENGRTVVTDCRTEIDMEEYTIPLSFTEQKLYHQALPLLDKSQVESVLREQTTGGITQGLYRKAGDDWQYYSYLTIDGVSYDLGYAGYGPTDDSILKSFGFLKTNISEDTPVYMLVRLQGTDYVTTAYYTITDGVPYLLYETDGWGIQKDIDGDGAIETTANTGTSTGQDYILYEWDLNNKSIRYVRLTEALNCDIVTYRDNSN